MKNTRGFTLLELLIGLTLLGFLLAVLFGGFRLAAKSWDSVETRLEELSREQMARTLLRRILTQMQPIRWQKAQNQAMAFVGEAGRLRAIAPVGGALGEGLHVIEFSLDHSGSTTFSGRLMFRHAAIDRENEDFAAGIPQAEDHVILDRLANARFQYFGSVKKGETAGWHESWNNTEELPRLVRIHIESTDPGWTDTITASALTAAAGCRWDDFYKRCR
jgi:general secretion pathway protein J